MYTYKGIVKLSIGEIVARHREGTLIGCLKLYSDNTECYIEDYVWEAIIRHIELGGELGCEC